MGRPVHITSKYVTNASGTWTETIEDNISNPSIALSDRHYSRGYGSYENSYSLACDKLVRDMDNRDDGRGRRVGDPPIGGSGNVHGTCQDWDIQNSEYINM